MWNGPARAGTAWCWRFCCGLMAKSMIVTLPCVLLLLDVWPLGRAKRLAVLWEKLPLLALAGGVSLADLVSQQQGHAVRSLASLPAGLRVANATLTYLVYMAGCSGPLNWRCITRTTIICPAGLWRPRAALAGITVLALRRFRALPVSRGRMVLVSRDSGAGDWIDPGRRAILGGPVHLPADGGTYLLCLVGARRTYSAISARQDGGNRRTGAAGVGCACTYLVPGMVLGQ